MPAVLGGVSIDTRTLQPGDLFVALQGENRDGHAFVADAFAKGAGAALIAHARARELAGTGALLSVPDVLPGLEAIGRAARARMAGRVLAVTGSVGKTGTKEALRHVLARQGATHASVASYNNHWGVPLTLARTPRHVAYGVYEMGMSAPEEIRPLSQMARPHAAIITTVAPVHIEFFKAIEGIADAKSEIFTGLEPGGVAILNRDNPHYERMRTHALASPAGTLVSFGEHAAADIRAETIASDPDGSDVTARLFGQALSFRVGLPGRHHALNAIAVLAGVWALGADVAAAAEALAGLAPVAGRGARETVALPGGGHFTLIDESYNANPASMRAALAVLGGLQPATGAAHRRSGRHAGTWRAGRDAACRACRTGAGGRLRAGFRGGALDETAVGCHSGLPSRGPCPQLGGSGTGGAGRHRSRRHRDGQGLQRQPHGAHRRRAEAGGGGLTTSGRAGTAA